MTEADYPLAVVLRALGLQGPVVSNWSARGLPGVVMEPSGRGKGRGRVLSLDAVQRLALIKALVDSHVPPSQAALWADITVVLLRSRPMRRITFWTYADGSGSWTVNDDPLDKELGDPWAGLTLHVAVIMAHVHEALKIPPQPAGNAPEVLVKSQKPAASKA